MYVSVFADHIWDRALLSNRPAHYGFWTMVYCRLLYLSLIFLPLNSLPYLSWNLNKFNLLPVGVSKNYWMSSRVICGIRPCGFKIVFMLNSAEHERSFMTLGPDLGRHCLPSLYVGIFRIKYPRMVHLQMTWFIHFFHSLKIKLPVSFSVDWFEWNAKLFVQEKSEPQSEKRYLMRWMPSEDSDQISLIESNQCLCCLPGGKRYESMGICGGTQSTVWFLVVTKIGHDFSCWYFL